MQTLSLLLVKTEDFFDKALDRLTTYRLVLYLLLIYLAGGLILSAWGKVPFSPAELAASAVFLLAVSRGINSLLAFVLKVPANQESDLITALILALILTPAADSRGYLVLGGGAAVAIASKFLVSIKGRHIFNPAAAGAFASGALFSSYASWWVGNRYMLPLVVVGGLLIARKMKRMQMILVFGAVYASYLAAYAPAEHLVATVWHGALNSAVIFFATVMLTEPLTSPTTLNQCLIYALAVGALYSFRQLHLAPEQALLAGNGLTFLMRPNRSMKLRFIGAKKEAEGIYSFLFETPKKFAFAPGQYLEWTLPGVRLDGRGNRRYLTIASSPTEKNLAFSVRMPSSPSGYKTALTKLAPGQQIIASQLAGDFILPPDSGQKLVFIAGGIGITPFRSMIKYLIDNDLRRDIYLLYSASRSSQLAFTQLLNNAAKAGVKPYYVGADPQPHGPVNRRLIAEIVPDWQDRHFYISGPQGFVASVRKELLDMGVSYSRIVTDFFPGYQ